MYATRLADICRAAGLRVTEVRGWKTRGHGPLTAVKTIVCHHTAGPSRGNMPSLNVVTNGRPGLSGPLANLALGRDGTVFTVAAGLAYHAGQVRSPSYANGFSLGIEAEGTGVDPWPTVQYEAYAELCAALATAFSVPASRVLGHKEVCFPVGRKSDPNFAMAPFRSKVARIMAAPTVDAVSAPAEVYAAVWRRDRMTGAFSTPDNPTWAPSSVLTNTYSNLDSALDAVIAADAAAVAVHTSATGAAASAKAAALTVQAAGTSATAAAADAAASRAGARRAEAALAALRASVTTSLAASTRAAVDASTVTVRVTVHQHDPAAPAPAPPTTATRTG